MEAIALVACVGLTMVASSFVLGRADVADGIAAVVRSGIAGGEPPAQPSPGALAFLDQALTPGDDAPALHDAVIRLAAEIGSERAMSLVLAAALRHHLPRGGTRTRALADPSLVLGRRDLNGVGPPAPGVWAETAMRAAPSARLIGIGAERTWRRALTPSRPQRIADAAASGAAAAFGALNPATAAVVLMSGALTAAGADVPRGAPPGVREDDLVLCRPIWLANRATPDWIGRNPYEAQRLRLDERVAAVELTVVRAGRRIQRAVVRSDATRC